MLYMNLQNGTRWRGLLRAFMLGTMLLFCGEVIFRLHCNHYICHWYLSCFYRYKELPMLPRAYDELAMIPILYAPSIWSSFI
jgi:hypothetical protein